MSHPDSFALALVLCLAGCSSTGIGNPGVADLSLTADPDVEPDAGQDTEQLASNALRHAVLVFGELRFLPCDPSEADSVASGPFVVDLAQNVSEPKIPEVTIPPGGFCGIDATLAPATEPATMAGRSMLFSGVGSDGTLFLLFADMPGTLRMRPLPAVDWSSLDEPALLWALRPKRWVLPSELTASDAETLGRTKRVIPIDVNQHPILYTAIRARIARRSTLHLDLNGNGRLDPDERQGDALVGQGLDNIDE